MLTPDAAPESDIATKVAVAMITEVFKSCLKGVSEAESWVRSKASEHDPFGTAARRYAEQFERRYNTIRVFGMAQPIHLRRVFVHVNMLTKITAEQRASIEDLNRFLDYDKRSFGRPIERTTGLGAVRKHHRLVVLGKPGAGKTTFLKHIALQALDRKLDTPRVPIFISLKDWSDSDDSLPKYMARQFEICAFPNSQLFIERILKDGKAILLFDGLDEVTRDVDNTIRTLRDFSDEYSGNQCIISCRVAAYNHEFAAFTDIEVADFNDAQIHQFIENWFGAGSRKAHACRRALASDPATKELASVPLLLTLLCLAFDEVMAFPANRAELYREAVDALLKKWDSSRSISRDTPYKRLTLKHKEAMLSHIAVQAFESKQYFMARQAITAQIASYIRPLQATVGEELDVDPDAILRSIIAQHGLLIERARGIFSFLHLTFHEYFVSRYIVDHQSKHTVRKLIDRHWDDRRWREVILLTAGMMAEADDLVECLLKHVEAFRSAPEYGMIEKTIELVPLLVENKGGTVLPGDLLVCHRVAGELKDLWLDSHAFEEAATLRDLQHLVESVLWVYHRIAQSNVTAISWEQNYARRYAYAVELLEQCLRSEAYLSTTTRKTVEGEVEHFRRVRHLNGLLGESRHMAKQLRAFRRRDGL